MKKEIGILHILCTASTGLVILALFVMSYYLGATAKEKYDKVHKNKFVLEEEFTPTEYKQSISRRFHEGIFHEKFLWTGGAKIDLSPLYENTFLMITQMNRVGKLKLTNSQVRYYCILLLETVMVESSFGYHISNKHDFGIFQVNESNFRDVNANYLAYKPKLKEYVKSHIIDEHGWRWNLKYNVRVGIAYSFLTYYRRLGHNPNLTTLQRRAKNWKIVYNTHKGAGKVKHYVNKNSTKD